MGKIVVKTDDLNKVNPGTGTHIHIPEELWELARKHTIMVADDHSGDRYLLIDMTEGKKDDTPKGPGFADPRS